MKENLKKSKAKEPCYGSCFATTKRMSVVVRPSIGGIFFMLLYAQDIKKEFGIQTVLDVKKLEIREGDRIALVGRNGAGKTTLFKILSGEMKPDSGSVTCNCEIAYISQEGKFDGEIDGRNISRMRLRDSAVKSGGEITRRAIASAFSKHTSLLFADEPTTNLDSKGVEELEKMLFGYRGAIVLISHDRQLINRICTQVWELDEGCIRMFPGNYTNWYDQRKREREYQQFEYDQYRREKKRLEKVVSDIRVEAKTMRKPRKNMSSSEWMLYKGDAAIRQGHVQKRGSALIGRLEHLEEKERPKELPKVNMKLGEYEKIRAKATARYHELSFFYEKNQILNHVTCDILSGKKTFLVGDNGSGKSTMLECLINHREGTFITSEAKVGYFSQSCDTLESQYTVLENVKSTAVVPEHICRAVLLNLYLKKNDFDKKVSVLSGGERVKVALAKVLVSGCNFLILDEPTNHMDIYTMEGLELLLSEFNGTLLVVSHDRAFVSNLADVMYHLENGSIDKTQLSVEINATNS